MDFELLNAAMAGWCRVQLKAQGSKVYGKCGNFNYKPVLSFAL
jgi:hypothetical protein